MDEELRRLSLETIHGLLQIKGTLDSDVFAKIVRVTQALRPVVEDALTSYTISDEIRDFLQEFNVVDDSFLEEAEDIDHQSDSHQSDAQEHPGSYAVDEETGMYTLKTI